ncbi:MAG: hypothetical protein M5U19_12895 [Microthrixaceae bacterium]|nr:hypothetical protein [Microthrixaceae bacterium]
MRYETLRERGAGQVAVLSERRRSIQAALDATVDAAVVASMESESSRLRAESEQIAAELASIATTSQELDASEDALAQRWAAFELEWGEGGGAERRGGRRAQRVGCSSQRERANRG